MTGDGWCVADSVPKLEYEETRNKAGAIVRAPEVAPGTGCGFRSEAELFLKLLPVEADDDLAVNDGGGGLGVHRHQLLYSVGVGADVLLGERDRVPYAGHTASAYAHGPCRKMSRMLEKPRT